MLLAILIILLLIVLNGVFAMSEAAVIAARKIRLQQAADGGDHRAQAALDLTNDPNRFLSTVQIGITLIGVLAGAFGGRNVAVAIQEPLESLPLLADHSQALSIGLVVLATTYLSLVIGELAPKRLALRNPERIAALVARPMKKLSLVAAPVVSVLSLSTDAVMWLLRARETQEPAVTDADIHALVRQGVQEGIFGTAEPAMVAGVLGLDELRVEAIMIPRTDVIWLDPDDPVEETQRKIVENQRSRFPVAVGGLDNVIGFVKSKDLLNRMLSGKEWNLKACLHEPLFVPESATAAKVLEMFRVSGKHIALVIGEYGGIEGLVTVNDVVEEIVGDVDREDPRAVCRPDGSWLVDGLLAAAIFAETLGVELPEEDGRYQTVSGFALMRLGHIPEVAESFDWSNWRFEVVDMDSKRIDKLLVTRIEPVEEDSP